MAEADPGVGVDGSVDAEADAEVLEADARAEAAVDQGERGGVGPAELAVLSTPGHSPGCCCFHDVSGGHVFSGDTLFCGGPGATGRSFSDFPTIITSIREQLLTLPPETVVHTGHGESTNIGAEAPNLEEWVRRGH